MQLSAGGAFVPERQEIELEIRAAPARPRAVTVDGRTADTAYDPESRTLHLTLLEDAASHVAEIAWI